MGRPVDEYGGSAGGSDEEEPTERLPEPAKLLVRYDSTAINRRCSCPSASCAHFWARFPDVSSLSNGEQVVLSEVAPGTYTCRHEEFGVPAGSTFGGRGAE